MLFLDAVIFKNEPATIFKKKKNNPVTDRSSEPACFVNVKLKR